MSAPATTRSTVTQTIEKDRDPAWKDPKYNDLLEQVMAEACSKLDSTATQYRQAYEDAEGRITKAIIMADGIAKLRSMLDDKVMGRFMALQGSKLGFVTDKDKNKDGSKGPGYSKEIVRDVLIEGFLIGVFPINNEINIIAGGLYVAQNGYKRLVREIPGVVVLQDTPGVPSVANGKVCIRYLLRWSRHGKDDQLVDHKGEPGRVIPVKSGEYTSDDAAIGKATRKAYKAAFEQITGMTIPDQPDEDLGEGEVSAPPATRTNLRGNGAPKQEEKIADQPQAPTQSDPTPDEADANWNDFTRDYQAAVNRGGVSDAIDIIDQWHATFAEHPKYKDQLFERMKHVESMQKAAPTAAPVASGSKGKSKLF